MTHDPRAIEFIMHPEENSPRVVSLLAGNARKLEDVQDLDALIAQIGDAQYVLLGEASHGTHEYYVWRMHITRRLIREKGFSFVAVEGDWPDCYRVNRYVKGYPEAGKDAETVLRSFNRWPTWMWANWEMVAFTQWLREHNEGQPANKKVGFYGLDVYSLFESLEAVVAYLEKNDPVALETAREAMRCFEPYAVSGERSYVRALALVPRLCEGEVVNLLREIRRRIARYDSDRENVFSAEQNALIAVNAEKYYQAMLGGGAESWNVRDRHMLDTLERLVDFHGRGAKVVVWAHNTHIGNARATDMYAGGMVNLGQLVAEAHTREAVRLVGFGSYKGTVIAGNHWGAEMKQMDVPPAKHGSWERLLHQAGKGENMLLLTPDLEDASMEYHFNHRAIGVVYHPQTEKYGNYVPSIIPRRYDAFLYFDRTRALHPLHIEPDGTQVPETYPFRM